jgi:type II secretory pathway pseudopilin PulG
MRREDGFTLIEVLLASAIMIVVLLATLSVADGYWSTDRRNQTQSDAQAALRIATDRVARELRNVASPGKQSGFERATGTDLVFDEIDPNGPDGGSNTYSLSRVRYCFDNSLPTNQRLWRETETWTTASPPTLPATESCPDFTASLWIQPPQLLLDHIVNSGTQPLFTYDSSNLSQISTVLTDFYVDYKPGSAPGPSELKTSVFTRNTTQPPTASIAATALGNRKLLLDGGGSSNPGNQTLTYEWQDGSTYIGCAGGTSSTPCSGPVIFTYTAATTGSHTFTLTVVSPNGLTATATQTVNVT